MKKVYRVDEGHRGHTDFEVKEDALQYVWSLARAQAQYDDEVDEEDLMEWGDCDETGWGVCPEGDTGAYWPQVSVYDDRGRSVHQEYFMQDMQDQD